jgi:hypothetical protein
VNEELGGIEYTDPKTGKMEKVKLDVIWEDNGYSVPKVITIYKRQRGAGCHMLSGVYAGLAEAVAETCSRDRMPIYAGYTNANPVIMKPKPLHLVPCHNSYVEKTVGIMKWIKEGWKEPRPLRFGIIGLDVPTLRLIDCPETYAQAKGLGVEFLGFEWVPQAVTDTTIEWTRLLAKNPDWVLNTHILGGAVVIMKDAMRLGLDKERVKIIHMAHVGIEELAMLVPEATEGNYCEIPFAAPTEDLPGVKLAKEVIRKYRNVEPTMLRILGTFYAMQTVGVLKQALETVGYEDLTRDAILDAMIHLKDFDSGGLHPRVTVKDPNYPVLAPYWKVVQVQKGKIVPVSDWMEFPSIGR